LLAFERAASQLSFRRAARDLSLSPSAISHQIRGLEEQFGVKLFVRGARSVRLTTDGERYFAKVSAALAALQDAGRDMLRHRRDAHAELWISSLPFFTSAVLIPALPEFKRRNPALTLRIEATHHYADFNASRVDVAIRYGREHSTGLKFEPLVAVKGLPVCAPALVKGGLKTPEDLSRAVLIHLTTQPRAWPAWLKEAGFSHLTPTRAPVARQRAGDAGGRRTGARRHARHVALDHGAAGLWQKANRALCVRGRAERDDLPRLPHRASARPSDRRGAALDRGGSWPRQIARARTARQSGSAARSAAI
jgi:DNA-binding transcriptional LysR family regulator